jgi:chromate transporter
LDGAIALAAFAALFLFAVPFPLVVLGAALFGMGLAPAGSGPVADTARASGAVDLRRTAATAALWLALWFAPFALLGLAGAGGTTLADIGWFFSKLAVVTFGGAYAVLSFMAQEAVATYHWLTPAAMIDGLGLAETTPGPLILVTAFVGYQAGFGQGGHGLGLAGAAMAIWTTFVPCFLWIFVGAPFIERLRGARRLAGALAAITAAVVGVILNLSLWFGLHVVFRQVASVGVGPLRLTLPDPASLDLGALALVALAAASLFAARLGVLGTLGACSLAGLVLRLAMP